MVKSIRERTQEKALAILYQNTHHTRTKDKTYSFILPSRDFYMHQWFWDSCIHAMGLIQFDQGQAFNEIESLLSGQWQNGHIGHITFSQEDTRYFPGPKVWGTKRFATKGVVSSGLIQPPLLAIAVKHMDDVLSEKGESLQRIDTMLEKVAAYHFYLKSHRDQEDSGLLTIIHPWESGTDNSPRWDSVLSHIEISSIPQQVITQVDTHRTDNKLGEKVDRPRNNDYYRYLYLVNFYKNLEWDSQKILATTPFALKDTLVNAIWAKANMALAKLFQKRNKIKEAALFISWSTQTKNALADTWDKEKVMYALIDVSAGQKRRFFADTIANFMPLYAHAATSEQRTALIRKLTNPQKYWSQYAVPSTAIDSNYFEESRYWRGPSWPITNLFLIEGLLEYKDRDCANRILEKTCAMIEKQGFFEYYNPEGKGKKGIGFGNFSWSAAIYLYLTHYIAQKLNGEENTLPAFFDSSIITL